LLKPPKKGRLLFLQSLGFQKQHHQTKRAKPRPIFPAGNTSVSYGRYELSGSIVDVIHGVNMIPLPASEKSVVEEKAVSGKILTGTETILLVDDEKMVGEMSREMIPSI
jgi:hypothetical protein